METSTQNLGIVYFLSSKLRLFHPWFHQGSERSYSLVRADARILVRRVCICIYSGSARLIFLKSVVIGVDSKEIGHAEHEYPPHPSPPPHAISVQARALSLVE